MTSAQTPANNLLTENSKPKRRPRTLQEQQRLWGWIFLSPWIFGFLAFTLIPIVASLIFTFTNFNLTRPNEIQFVGLANWQKLLNDPAVGVSLTVTFRFALVAIPLSIILPLGLAALLNAPQLWGKRFFRTLFYMPYMVPAVSAIFIWQSFLNSESGWMNRIIRSFGLVGPNWMDSIDWIYPALYIIGIWGIGNAMITILATMQGVPTELYEASKVDGAGPMRRFWSITIPMISPVIFYNLILTMIGLLQYFEVPYILKQGTGNPGNSTYFFNIHLYKTAFTFQDMGYGATLAWLMFIIALGLTIFLFATSRRWVYYASGD